jgi:hypothetical protein
MRGTAVSIVNNHRLLGEAAQALKRDDERAVDFQLAATAASELALRKMRAQISQLQSASP